MCIQFEIMITEMCSAIVGQHNDWQIGASINVHGGYVTTMTVTQSYLPRKEV
jgi:hypothetical protein